MRHVACEPCLDSDEFVRDLQAHFAAFKRHFESAGAFERPQIREEWYKRFRQQLLDAFCNKCAYCEIPLLGQGKGDVEHFRPKNAVQDRRGKPVLTRDGKPHPGYWWLAYEWGNLLPACRDCNATQQKGNRFPVNGQYAECPEETDDALLINSLVDDPSKHLRWNVATGMPVGLDARGKATIEVLRFRQREALNDMRKQQQAKAEDAVVKIMTRKCSDSDLRKAKAFIREANRGSVPFSAYTLAAIERAKSQHLERAKEIP